MVKSDYKGKIILNWNEYEEYIKKISLKIIEDFPDYKNIGIIGIARGGLAILTSVAYQLDTRNIAVIQITMSGLGEYDSANKALLIGEFFRDDIDKYIIVEDILVTGKTIEEAVKRLDDNKKELVGIYSLFMVDDFKNEFLENRNLKIWSATKNKREDWIEFPWDKKLI